jgi:hypothetical protein
MPYLIYEDWIGLLNLILENLGSKKFKFRIGLLENGIDWGGFNIIKRMIIDFINKFLNGKIIKGS